jgi:hypothetical protein
MNSYIDEKFEKDGQYDWNADMLQSVQSRRNDYLKFKTLPSFPQLLKFNLKAEFYHAEFEYELFCTIEQKLLYVADNVNRDLKSFDEKVNGLKAWQESNLTISDVLNVSKKADRINLLQNEIKKQQLITKSN